MRWTYDGIKSFCVIIQALGDDKQTTNHEWKPRMYGGNAYSIYRRCICVTLGRSESFDTLSRQDCMHIGRLVCCAASDSFLPAPLAAKIFFSRSERCHLRASQPSPYPNERCRVEKCHYTSSRKSKSSAIQTACSCGFSPSLSLVQARDEHRPTKINLRSSNYVFKFIWFGCVNAATLAMPIRYLCAAHHVM